jgi:DNA polymerase V
MDGSISGVFKVKKGTRLFRPLFESHLPAGFPSPSEEYIEERIDLNRDLIFHPQYTYYARIAGDSMIGEGLWDGSIVAFDRKLEAQDGDIVVARVDCSDLCCKIYRNSQDDGSSIHLEPANHDYPSIVITGGMDLQIVGLVTFSIHWHAKRYGRRFRVNRLQ